MNVSVVWFSNGLASPTPPLPLELGPLMLDLGQETFPS